MIKTVERILAVVNVAGGVLIGHMVGQHYPLGIIATVLAMTLLSVAASVCLPTEDQP